MTHLLKDWKSHSRSKWIHPEEIEAKVQAIRAEGVTIATLNGSFDLLHAGHLYMIYEAAKMADILILAVNTDESIKRYKSRKRPIVPLQYRLEMLSALEFIHFLTWFDESDPREILKKIKPDVHVNGIEYGPNCIEAEVVKEGGGRLHLVDRIPGLATSQLIETIQNLGPSCV